MQLRCEAPLEEFVRTVATGGPNGARGRTLADGAEQRQQVGLPACVQACLLPSARPSARPCPYPFAVRLPAACCMSYMCQSVNVCLSAQGLQVFCSCAALSSAVQ